MITVSHETIRERVARGATLLDTRSPNWWRHLQPESVEMHYGQLCVLGQLNPWVGYLGMLYELGLDPSDEAGARSASHHGFDLTLEESEVGENHLNTENYARLTDAWRNLIASRQIEAGLR